MGGSALRRESATFFFPFRGGARSVGREERTRMRGERLFITSSLAFSAAVFGCGGKATQAPPVVTPEVEVKAGAPASATASTVEALDMSGTGVVLGTSQMN